MCTAEKQRAQIVQQCYTNINSMSSQDQEVVVDPQVSPEEIKSREVILRWSLWTLYLHACQVSYHRQLKSLSLYLGYVFQALINSLGC